MAQDTGENSQTQWLRVHYLSDFDFFMTPEGTSVIGGKDFSVELRPEQGFPSYKVWRRGGECSGGVEVTEDGAVHVNVDRHHLPPGKLYVRLSVENPEADFPDGSRRTVWDFPLGVELVRGTACNCGTIQVLLPGCGMTEITADEVEAIFSELGGTDGTEQISDNSNDTK